MRKKSLMIAAACASLLTTAYANSIPQGAQEYNGHYYYVFTNVTDNWVEAENYCESLGGHLAVITSDAENRFVYDLMKKSTQSGAYFGLIKRNDGWQWINGESLYYTNWNIGEPSGDGPCGNFWPSHSAYHWNDYPARGITSFICEWDSYDDRSDNYNGYHSRNNHYPNNNHPSNNHSNIPSNAQGYNGHYYQLFDNISTSWNEAEHYCESRGGHLVTINSSSEQQFVENLIRSGSKNSYWIGGYKDSNNYWNWITGESFNYTNWAPRQPDNNGGVENALMMYRNVNSRSSNRLGQWNDISWNGTCNNEEFFGTHNIGFICEWDNLSVNNYNQNNNSNSHHNNNYNPNGQNSNQNNANSLSQLKGGTPIVMLRFDDSTIRDEAGNSWRAVNNPTLDTFGNVSGKALSLNNNAYLQLTNPITFGGRDFTIDFWVDMFSYSGAWSRVFVFYQNDSSNQNAIMFHRYGSGDLLYTLWNNTEIKNDVAMLDQLSHVAIVYQHNLRKLKTYINGKLTSERDCTIPRTTFKKGFIGKSNYSNDGLMVGTLDEFRIVDGAALWTANFNPPTKY